MSLTSQLEATNRWIQVTPACLATRREEEEEEVPDDEGGEPARVGMLPSSHLDAVLKLFCTHTTPNYSLPWQMRRQGSSTGSGFVIDGKRILTNAHC